MASCRCIVTALCYFWSVARAPLTADYCGNLDDVKGPHTHKSYITLYDLTLCMYSNVYSLLYTMTDMPKSHTLIDTASKTEPYMIDVHIYVLEI